MKRFLVVLSVLCVTALAFSDNKEKADPQDTLRVYYLDEVVVSSSVKETNNLKNMPTAVSVISPKQLKNTQIESLPDLSSYIPNFFIPKYGSKVSTPIYIRGIGARLGSQTVSLYVDNVPSFNPSAFDFEFQDIQRIEVLRGAQGTLYGRNAIGGIVNLYTLSPLTYQGIRFSLSGGNYGQFSVMGSNYSKLSEKIGLSAAAYYKRDDGYFMNSYTNEKVDNSENAGGKIKLEWQVSPDFKAMLFGNYDYVSGGAFPYMHVDSTKSSFNEPSSYDRHLFTNGLSLDWQRNGYSIHSTTGFQYLKDDMKMDQDYTTNSVFSINQMQEQHSLSQEFTVKSAADRDYRWVVGAFGFYDRRVIDTPVALKEDMIAFMQSHLPAFITYDNDQIDLPGVYTKPSKGAALFHQSTFTNLFGLENLSATAGIRLDYEHTGIDFSTESIGGDLTVRPPRTNMVIPVDGDTIIEGSYCKDFLKLLPKFALQYQFSPTSQIYLSASRGYKTGGFNEQLFSEVLQSALAESLMRKMQEGMGGMGGPPSTPPSSREITPKPTLKKQLSYDPETSWTYELGGRYEMFNKKLSLTYALFYTRVNDIQIIKLTRQGTSGRTVENAGNSESKGFELSLRYSPIRNLSFYGDYGFADARFKDYEFDGEELDDEGNPIMVDYSGNYIPFAPRHTLSLGAGYVHNFGYGSFIDRIVANLQYTGVGKIYWTESNEDVNGEELYQPFYGLVNGSISAEKGSFALELWGKNLLGKDYNSFLFEATDMTTGNTNSFVQRGYPTRVGATLRYTIDR
ncbi:MAG: TonB-dependent receptor [Fermentimonas sp.]|mgnify:CR=1 FL=1|nr:TonB-dependent receptor [Fermentimonas sp.]MDD2930500.1 TonB-dependent receptor [Fermentimonas sp.]MDD3188576.1 TonB-dependent receptor [Fermentimonas sp.]MDD3511892.1 TonB-dependent receptor [Fermentimonas sp.]MDD4283556.1 TonB-dependent receptor [Fermentimonas sp.]